MARKGHGKRRKGYRYLPVDESAAIGALATNVVGKSDLNSTVDNDMWFMSHRGPWSMEQHTPGEGPITVGLAHGDYTAAEIEECLEAQASWDEGDKVAQEQARRKVRTVGIFPGVAALEVLNDGRPIKTKLGFRVQIGETLSLWFWNKDSATLTTGTMIETQGGISARRL